MPGAAEYYHRTWLSRMALLSMAPAELHACLGLSCLLSLWQWSSDRWMGLYHYAMHKLMNGVNCQYCVSWSTGFCHFDNEACAGCIALPAGSRLTKDKYTTSVVCSSHCSHNDELLPLLSLWLLCCFRSAGSELGECSERPRGKSCKLGVLPSAWLLATMIMHLCFDAPAGSGCL
jgi:hypothetical protein